VYIDSFLWRDAEKAGAAAARLADALGMPFQQVLDTGRSQDEGDVILLRQLPYEAGVALQDLGLWGVRTLPSARREYAESDLAGALIGYVGRDGSGLWGIEADYDPVLRGLEGYAIGERDGLGRPIAFSERVERAPQPGGEVQLTVDRYMQAIAEEHLRRAVEEYQATGGTVLIMNPHTGAILAMASLPSVSLSTLDLTDPDLSSLTRNRAITDLYEPGSVLKTLTTAAAIDLGLVSPDTTYDDTGAVQVGTDVIRNWDFSANGVVTMTEFLQRSLNTGAVWLSQQIGAERFYQYLLQFGLGEPTHVGLSGEAEGIVRTVEDDEWYPVDLATNAYGQGLAATPLQVLTAVNAFANGGELMRPYVVSHVVGRDGVRTYEPVVVRQVISPETARTMASMMRDVVEGVPTHGARVPGYQVAGKTGTTLVSIPTGYDLNTTIASFVGFLPYEDPQVSILVKIDQPGGERNLGGEVAAPVFAGIAADVMEYLNIPADADRVAAP
jgi:cell division protein FtsI/penicillin-binding protein 2